MRRAVAAVAAAVVLAAPTVLAFYSGGYFAEPRLIAGLAVWALVLALAVAGPAPLPRGTPGRLALAGLVLLTAWSALSLAWAPLGGPAIANVQRLLLYAGAFVAAVGALRAPRARAAVEPALAAGATIVIGYGLAGRLLPGILELDRSRSAGGRLEQPITYWNAEGALAALGLVLAARVAGDRDRPVWMRALAAAVTPLLGAAVYLSYSRGALVAGALGLVVLVALAPTATQLRAAVAALAVGAPAAAVLAAFPAVASLEGSLDDRVREGAICLAALALIAVAAALLAARWARAERGRADPEDTLDWAPQLRLAAAAALAVVVLGLVLGGVGERPTEAELARGATAGRLATVSSNRYEYWRVALVAFKREPIIGVGSGGFRVEWLRERSIPEAVRDAHSLELELAAELGLVGLLAFLLMVGGVVAGARGALRRGQPIAAGAGAAALVWLVHASIDWDWQLPAVTLPAVALAGALVCASEAVNGEAR